MYATTGHDGKVTLKSFSTSSTFCDDPTFTLIIFVIGYVRSTLSDPHAVVLVSVLSVVAVVVAPGNIVAMPDVAVVPSVPDFAVVSPVFYVFHTHVV